MITGGADSKIHPLSLVRMTLLDQMSSWKGDPHAACRPFDRQRDGWVPGEGAGILILEEREHALQARGHASRARFWATAAVATPIRPAGSTPKEPGPRSPSRAAIKDAGLEPGQVGHVNAHGAGSVKMDLAEARALNRVFGPEGVPVTSLKGYFGNIVSGAGAVELVASLLA